MKLGYSKLGLNELVYNELAKNELVLNEQLVIGYTLSHNKPSCNEIGFNKLG